MEWQVTEALAKQEAPKLATRIREAGRDLPNEATFRSRVQPLIEEFCQQAGVTVYAQHERTLASGRADTVFNRLVVEYKRPGVLRGEKHAKSNRVAVQRLKDYIEALAKAERQKLDRIAGVLFDGFRYIFVRRLGETWHEDEPTEVNAYSTERFLRMLVSLSSGVALTADNLIRDFGIHTVEDPRRKVRTTQVNIRTQRLLRAMVDSLKQHVPENPHPPQTPLVQKLFQQWTTFFSEVIEYKEAFSGPKLHALNEFARRLGCELKDPQEGLYFFFSIHTYFALLVKLLAWLAISRYIGLKLGVPAFAKLATLPSEELRRQLQRMEEGGIFAEYGIRNLLEGDFFSWYLYVWDGRLEQEVRALLERLSDYDPSTLEINPEETRDLLKKLYHYLMPREIRHNLGEYYTPDWLAQRLLNQVDSVFFTDRPERSSYVRENLLRYRFLDPACGSGTFLVLIIKRIREGARHLMLPEEQVLDAILHNVVGIDLNPLAVIAARTNYLLALGELLEHRKGDINIPVYLADSIVTPAKGEDLFRQGRFYFKTSVGEFAVPQEVVERGRLDRLADLLDEAVRAGVNPQVLVERCKRELRLTEAEFTRAVPGLLDLYQQVADLHRQGMNGIWARILKNAFAPLFVGQFDYVVGNPPWVNWENLPDGYRDETKRLWIRQGVFPHGGMDTILGKGKKDISMLMASISMAEYLKEGGKLGFLITQSVFKTSGAGQGFRRFVLGDGTYVRVLHVDDMVELNAFEGASNRTAAVILEKGQQTRYPVPYTYWKKTIKGKSIGFDMELGEVEAMTKRLHLAAEPVDSHDATSAWLSGSPLALKAIRKVLGKSDYEAHAGVYTGGANAVYWVDIVAELPGNLVLVSNITEGAKREVEPVQRPVERELLYPLLRGRDVKRWQAQPSAYILMVQDPVKRRGIDELEMQKKYPKTWSYLKGFEEVLKQRAAYKRYFDPERDPFYSMFDVGDYTFAPYKVVWPWISEGVRAVVVSNQDYKVVVPEHNSSFVGCSNGSEAHYICALLNSSVGDFGVRSFYSGGGGGIGSPRMLENVSISRFDPQNPVHLRLAELSQKAHELAAKGDTKALKEVEKEIDDWAARLWGLTDKEMAEIQRSLKEMIGGDKGGEPAE
jgi:SAM-dependent methyltransferase